MKKVKLGEVCEIVTGSTPKSTNPDYWNGEYKWITPAEISDDDFIIVDTQRKISKLGIEKTGLKSFPIGTVLLSSRAPIGKVAIAGCEMYCNQGFKNFICSNEINNEYLFYFLKSRKNFLNNIGRGATFKEISKSIISNIEIILPSYNVQCTQTQNLKKIDNLIYLRNKVIKEYQLLVKSRFNEMFGDPVLNEMGWEIETLNKIGTIGRGVSKHRPRNASELFGGIYPFIQTGDVANSGNYIVDYHSTYSEFGLKQSKLWDRGTLCITIAANIAKTSILAFDSCFPDSIVGFIPGERTNNMFIHYWFSYFQKILESQAPESAQKNINLKILSELKVILPPLSLQNEFADFVAKIDKSQLAIQKSLEELETLKKSLMQEYFG